MGYTGGLDTCYRQSEGGNQHKRFLKSFCIPLIGDVICSRHAIASLSGP